MIIIEIMIREGHMFMKKGILRLRRLMEVLRLLLIRKRLLLLMGKGRV